VGQEGSSDYRYLYNPQVLPSASIIPNSVECEEFSNIVDKAFKEENDINKPFGCYTNLGFVMYNANTSSNVLTVWNENYRTRMAMKDWELYTISILKNGYKRR
tara:strand:+ start:173 stop:481 length:309 start_codon:yes stop_codon:yes gene_type:complete